MGYTIQITRRERMDLGWVANRYESARVLYDGMEPVEEDMIDDTPGASILETWEIPESVAWEYMEALREEDGNVIVPPRIGGQLADKLVAFLNSIV